MDCWALPNLSHAGTYPSSFHKTASYEQKHVYLVHADVDHETSPPPSQLLFSSMHADIDHEASPPSPPPSQFLFGSVHTNVDTVVSDVFEVQQK